MVHYESIGDMKVAVLLSGGVDSSVALKLLQQEGHDVTAFYLKIWLEDELSFLGNCPWEEDLSYARQVCEQAGVELQIVPFQQQYHQTVIATALAAIKLGATPNPDMLCNTMIKFGAFYDQCGHQFDKIATGHYAHVIERNALFSLAMTPDSIKDQTYFLARLTQAQLSRALFPLGPYTKQQVRELAQQFNLPNQTRKDSQGLCFLGKISFAQFIRHHLGTQTGPFVEYETGKTIATHEGFWFYTAGQRKGIGLSGGPWYVVDKDPLTNTVFISREYYAPEKLRDTFVVSNATWFAGHPPHQKDLSVKIRHGQQLYRAQYTTVPEGLQVKLSERDQGIAPGQFAVFYHENECLGCGVIARVVS